MNDRERSNLFRILNGKKGICINIAEFTDFLRDKELGETFDPIVEKDILMSGLYGYLGETKVFVSRAVPPGYMRFSELESPSTKTRRDWSIDFKLDSEPEEIDRLIDLMPFW